MDPMVEYVVSMIEPVGAEQMIQLLMVRPEWASRCDWNIDVSRVSKQL
jgi:hypothetical protein